LAGQAIFQHARADMSKVFVSIALSLDGYMAPDGMTMEHWDDPGYENWGAKWGALTAWIIINNTSARTSNSDREERLAPSMT
jgi:predicted acetyltransferase